MNDQEPGVDDPGYDDVRALLAEAAATGPVPPDVAARLDATLASLTADRRPAVAAPPVPDLADPPGVVVPLRRRSRVGARLLAAAAAVVVVGAGGIGISQVLTTDGADQGVADSTSTLAEADDFGAESAPEAPVPGGPLDLPDSLRDEAFSAANPLPSFTTAGFAAEAAAFRDPILALTSLDSATRKPSPGTTDGYTGSETGAEDPERSNGGSVAPQDTTTDKLTSTQRRLLAYDAAKAACPGPVGIGAVLVPIRYDAEPAALAIYPAGTDGRRYEAWSCDGTTLLASTVVPR